MLTLTVFQDPTGQSSDPAGEDSSGPPFRGAAHPPLPAPHAPLLQTSYRALPERPASAGHLPKGESFSPSCKLSIPPPGGRRARTLASLYAWRGEVPGHRRLEGRLVQLGVGPHDGSKSVMPWSLSVSSSLAPRF